MHALVKDESCGRLKVLQRALDFDGLGPMYDKVCYRWNVKRASFLLGVGAFRSKFYGNGITPGQNVDIIRSATAHRMVSTSEVSKKLENLSKTAISNSWLVDCATTLPLEVFRQWNFVANFLTLLMVFGRNFCKKDKIGYLNPFLGKLGWHTTFTLVDGSLESPRSTFYSRLLNFFRY